MQLTEVWAADLYDMPENLLYPYLDMFSRNVVPYMKEVNDFQTKQALKGSDITCPPANDALFHTYLNFMEQSKLILPPDSSSVITTPTASRELPGQKIKVKLSVVSGGDI
ncbi:hypothetical protein HW132_34415 [Brasilonema sp. CT11]|nr:hypothetical protein [Brasilonema sp. CT11]